MNDLVAKVLQTVADHKGVKFNKPESLIEFTSGQPVTDKVDASQIIEVAQIACDVFMAICPFVNDLKMGRIKVFPTDGCSPCESTKLKGIGSSVINMVMNSLLSNPQVIAELQAALSDLGLAKRITDQLGPTGFSNLVDSFEKAAGVTFTPGLKSDLTAALTNTPMSIEKVSDQIELLIPAKKL